MQERMNGKNFTNRNTLVILPKTEYKESKMVNELWKQELRPKFFCVEHHKPDQFVTCQWQSQREVHILYFIYRWIMAAIFLIILICSICDAGRSEDDVGVRYIKWGIYLTNWGFTLCTFQALLAAGLLTQQFWRERKHGKYIPAKNILPVGYQLYWVFHSVSTVMAVGITACYWATVYNPEMHKLDALNVLVHAFNTVFMLVDFLLVAHPFRLLHCYWPFLFAVVYIVFNFIYFELGGTDKQDRSFIYPLLDWRRPRRCLLATAFGLVFILVVHCALWILFLIRRWFAVLLSRKFDKNLNVEISSQSQTAIPMDVVDC